MTANHAKTNVTLILAAACAFSAAATAQQDSLLFTTLGNEQTRSVLPPDSLQNIEPEDVNAATGGSWIPRREGVPSAWDRARRADVPPMISSPP